jgi:hypothetical protein
MRKWKMTREPNLDDLLDDEIIDSVMRRDGLDASELRRQLEEVADRLADRSAEADSRGGSGFR